MDTLNVGTMGRLRTQERQPLDLQGDDSRQMDLRTMGKGEAISHQAITQGSAGSMETFTHGKVMLMHADCMEYMAGLPDGAFDLVIADPPYFAEYAKEIYPGAAVSTTGIKRHRFHSKAWEVPTQNYFDELVRVSSHQIIWGYNYYEIMNLGSGRIIWDKKNDESSFSKCEIAYCSLHKSVQIFRHLWNGMLQENMKQKEARIHPTQKPTALYEWLLTNYAKTGQRILDTHLGSGSSAIAAHNLGFEFVGMELDADYYAAAVKRFKAHAAQESLFGSVYDQVEREEYSQGDLL